MEARAGWRGARDPGRGDDLEGAARLEPRRPAGGLQLLSRRPVAPALADDARRVESAAADLRRVRRHRAPLVVRRAAHRLRVERGREHVALGRSTCRAAAGRAIRAERRDYRSPVGRLRLRVTDARGAAVPARVSVTGPDGRSWAPDDAWRHADDGFDRRERRFEYGYFHTTGRDSLTLPAGEYAVEVTRGPETRVERRTVAIRAGARQHAPGRPGAARRPRPARLVQRRPARAHELRRRLPHHAAPAGVPGAGGGPRPGREPDRQQGRAHPRHRTAGRPRPGLHRHDRRGARSGVPHERLGPHRPARAPRSRAAAGLRRLRGHGRRQPRADQRRGGGSRAGAGRAGRLRASVRQRPRSRRHHASAHGRVPGRPGARQGGLLRGARLRRRPDGDGARLVPRAQLRLPPAGGRGHRRDGQLRLAARAGGDEPRLRAHRRAARPAAAARFPQGRAHVRDQRAAAGAHDRRARRGRRAPAGRWDARGRRAGVAPVERAGRSPRDRGQR